MNVKQLIILMKFLLLGGGLGGGGGYRRTNIKTKKTENYHFIFFLSPFKCLSTMVLPATRFI